MAKVIFTHDDVADERKVGNTLRALQTEINSQVLFMALSLDEPEKFELEFKSKARSMLLEALRLVAQKGVKLTTDLLESKVSGESFIVNGEDIPVIASLLSAAVCLERQGGNE